MDGKCRVDGCACDPPNAMGTHDVVLKCGCATLVISGAAMSSVRTMDSMANEIPSAFLRRRRSRAFVAVSPSTKHRARVVPVAERSGSIFPLLLHCMDAPLSGGLKIEPNR